MVQSDPFLHDTELFCVLLDTDMTPEWLVKLPARLADPMLWSQRHENWVLGWVTLVDEVTPGISDNHLRRYISADEVEGFKTSVRSPSDEDLARWEAP